jgi:hypothetical protein
MGAGAVLIMVAVVCLLGLDMSVGFIVLTLAALGLGSAIYKE